MIQSVNRVFLKCSVFLLAGVLIVSCRPRDDDARVIVDPPGGAAGAVKLEFTHKAGNDPLVLNTQWYKNEHGDSFTVSKFNYYISNIRLSGQATYEEEESYHLIEHNKSTSLAFDLKDVPYGSYNSITFLIGVDSARNVDGAQTGALDPVHGMFWSWVTGYIMVKFEGKSPQSSAANNEVQIHCGGFSGPNSVLKEVTIALPQTIEVNSNVNHIHIDADALKLFKSPNVIDFSVINHVMSPGASARMVADNYAGMFSVSYAGL